MLAPPKVCPEVGVPVLQAPADSQSGCMSFFRPRLNGPVPRGGAAEGGVPVSHASLPQHRPRLLLSALPSQRVSFCNAFGSRF